MPRWGKHIGLGLVPVVTHSVLGAVRTTPKTPVELESIMKALFVVGTMVVYIAPPVDGPLAYQDFTLLLLTSRRTFWQISLLFSSHDTLFLSLSCYLDRKLGIYGLKKPRNPINSTCCLPADQSLKCKQSVLLQEHLYRWCWLPNQCLWFLRVFPQSFE